MRRLTYLIAALLLLDALLMADEKTADSSPKPSADAQRVYQLLLKEYKGRKAIGAMQIERLQQWSLRIVQAEAFLDPSDAKLNERFKIADEASLRHAARMREVLKLVPASPAGEALDAERAAARFFVAEAERSPNMWSVIARQQMSVELPKASEARPLIVRPIEMIVSLTKEGKIFVGGKEITAEDLTREIERQRKREGQLSVIIRADKRCQLDLVVRVIDVCNKAGVSHSLTTAAGEDERR